MPEIIAGKRISSFELGMHLEALIEKFEDMGIENFERRKLHSTTLITAPSYMFWIDDDSKQVTQITVSAGFQGKFLDTVGIGSTLGEVKETAGEYYEELDVFKLKDYPGICFEVGDSGTDTCWDETNAPVEDISVYFED
ncbi:MAG: hypothetical protein IT327_17020 [Anaerolineae bacterium]|nr:hypothetical protein [Anaerolineae bacterium]